MKKNLKGCIEKFIIDNPELLISADDSRLIESAGLKLDSIHKKSAKYAAAWRFADTTSARLKLRNEDLSSYRYLSLSVFSVAGMGGSFSLFFDCGTAAKNGYECTLPITRDG